MADTAIAITAGTGTNVDTRTEATNGNHRQVVVLGDPSTNAGVAPVDATKGLAVDLAATGANATALKVNVASGGIASGAVASGAYASGSISDGADVNAGATGDAASATTTMSAKLRAIATALGTTALDLGSGTSGTRTIRTIVDSSQLAALSTTQPAMAAGFQSVGFPSDLPWPKGLSNRLISAVFSTLTRPANTTAYTAGDSISDNATAGSVTVLSATLSDVNDDPVFVSEILINSTDTGLAGKRIRAYVYNSDPTASSGVSGGDNAAFSNKKAGYIGSFSGRMEAGFSDGTVGRLIPSFQLAADTTDTAGSPAGGFIVTKPTSGAKTLFIQFQAIDVFTPSANSTTIIATARGWQGRAV